MSDDRKFLYHTINKSVAEIAALKEQLAHAEPALAQLETEKEDYRARWLSCVTPEEAQRLRDEIATLRERLEWRDISTAPKDGTPIWLLTKAYTDPGDPPIFHPARCSIGKWDPDGDSWTDEYGSLDGPDVCQLTVTGFWASGGGWFQPNEVTHWMPLPLPPDHTGPKGDDR